MNNNHTKPSTGRRITAATLLAGAIAAGGLGAAATAAAAPPGLPIGPSFSAIAFSSDTGVWASWTNARSFDDANRGALGACQDAGGSHCVLTGYVSRNFFSSDQCVALAVDAVNWELWHSGQGPTVVSSQTAALQANGGGRIATVSCTASNGPDRAFTGRVNQPQTS